MHDDTLPGRVPPHNEDAERSIIGALLLDPDRIPDVAEILRVEDFFDRRLGVLFDVLTRMSRQSVPIDFLTVDEALRAAGKATEVGGKAYLMEVAGFVTSAAHLRHHLKIVTETAVLRRVIAEATGVLTEAFETRPDGEAVQELLDRAEDRMLSIAAARDSAEAEPITKAIEETFHRLEAISKRGGAGGVPSGFYDLDEITAGFHPGDLVIVAARPSMGKTAFVLNIMEHAATHRPEWMDRDLSVLMFSLEMGRQSLAARMLCTRARVDAHKLRTGRIPAEDWSYLNQAAGELSQTSIFIDDTPGLSVMGLRSRARRIKRQHGLDLVIVDYLQLMSIPGSESRQLEISAISRSLKELARELPVPVIALSQLSRAVESREDKRPQLSDLRESGSIEQDADVVMMLYRPEYYAPTEENRGLAEVIVGKQRNGPTGTVRLQFFGSTMRFENRTPSMAEPIVP